MHSAFLNTCVSRTEPPRRLRTSGFFLLLILTFADSAPMARAQLSPPPDGGYPGDNTAEGDRALFSLTTGRDNTAVGASALFRNTFGENNTAIGSQALFKNTNGEGNTATGASALVSNTSSHNTANGHQALFNNTIGFENTAIGWSALYSNIRGNFNTAIGAQALGSNSSGGANTAIGNGALSMNAIGSANTATGASALAINYSGSRNTAVGETALQANYNGALNTAIGFEALRFNEFASNNTATGELALHNNSGDSNTATGGLALMSNTTGAFNTADGFRALLNNTMGSRNIAMGVEAGSNLTTGSNNIDIGASGVAGESGVIRIGKTSTATATFIAGISGKTVANGLGVIINTSGQLGTILSSARYKEAIKPMDTASEAILALQPVRFRYKHELDPDGIPQFGLVAEQVEKVNPDLVVRDADGKVNTVRYEAVNAMLLNEFLKEHRRVEEQRAYFELKLAQQQKQIEALTATIQKVSDRVAHSDLAPQLVVNP